MLLAQHSLADQLGEITVADGFTVEVAASQPLVRYPMMGCLDDRGRLFIASSGGFNLDDKQLDDRRPNFIRMLEDVDGDGVFDKSTIFADKLALPNGALWHDGSLYVAEPPGIWRFTDTDDDGVADQREHIAGNVRYNGMSSTLHGPVMHPNGCLYWCGGQRGYSLDKNGEMSPERIVPGVFSLRVDGRNHEVFSVGGSANPVEVTFSEAGDVFGTMAIFESPDGERHDALLHWVYGGQYRPRKGRLCPLPSTGPSLPPLSYVGQVAPAGLTSYRGTTFGESYRGNLFWSQFNTHRVMRTRLTPDGASFSSQDETLMSCDDVNFHPTDVIEDADGSLLVIDTGGWFRHGCPTSHLANKEALGAIYRIRRTDAVVPEDPRGTRLEWAKAPTPSLIERLDDDRPAVRDRSIAELARRGPSSFEALKQSAESPSDRTRRNALWALSRIGGDPAWEISASFLNDIAPSVRQAAANVCGAAGTEAVSATLQLANQLAVESDLAVAREIATALGRIRDRKAVPALLAKLQGTSDRFLTHSLVFALITIGDSTELLRGLDHASPSVRRGSLLALSQLGRVDVDVDTIQRLLRSKDTSLRRAAFTIAASDDRLRSAWIHETKDILSSAFDAEARDIVAESLAEQIELADTQVLVADILNNKGASREAVSLILDVIQNASPIPETWLDGLRARLTYDDNGTRRSIVSLATRKQYGSLRPYVKKLAIDTSLPRELRLESLSAVANSMGRIDEQVFAFVVTTLDNSDDPRERLAAARLLSQLKLSDAHRIRVAPRLEHADALLLPTLILAFGSSSDRKVGNAFVESLAKSANLRSLSTGDLARLLDSYPAEVRDAGGLLLEIIDSELAMKQSRLVELQQNLDAGDALRGKAVFFGKKAQCATCHRVSGQGGVVGPNLTRVGEIRTRRDLLESVVYPSASIVQGYHPFTVLTTQGSVFTGLVVAEDEDSIWLRGSDLRDVVIRREDIEARSPSTTSVMPRGLEEKLAPLELADLLAYLQSLKRLSSFQIEE